MQRQRTSTQSTTATVQTETRQQSSDLPHAWSIEDAVTGMLVLAGLIIFLAVLGFAVYFFAIGVAHAAEFISQISPEAWRKFFVALSVLASAAMVLWSFTIEPTFLITRGPDDPNEDALFRYLKLILKSVGVTLLVSVPMLYFSWVLHRHLPYTAVTLGFLVLSALTIKMLEIVMDLYVLILARIRLGPGA
ncbi:MAG: hypothetical protein AAF999_17695 [Pseudomonadota bacterium]